MDRLDQILARPSMPSVPSPMPQIPSAMGSLAPAAPSATIPVLANYYAANIPNTIPQSVPADAPASGGGLTTFLQKLWKEYKLLGICIVVIGIYVYWKYYHNKSDDKKESEPSTAKALPFMNPATTPSKPTEKKAAVNPLENDPNFTPLVK
jgi:hypothetical protein